MHTYLNDLFLSVRNAIDDLGFLDQVIGIELSNLDQVTGIALRQTWVLWGGVLHNYCSICRLNLKFECSAMHTY